MITLGIDLSSQPKGTAAAVIHWSIKEATAEEPKTGCSDEDLYPLINRSQVIGIDAPFGWPLTFVDAAQHWPHSTWNIEIRDSLRFRTTDLHVRSQFGANPLSVSTDQIALPAMRAMSLLGRYGVKDRSGDGRFFEVYPVASLRAWDIAAKGYKDAKLSECLAARHRILNMLRQKLSWLNAPDSYARTSDSLDALVASLSARVAAQGRSHRPTSNQTKAAESEGWIHIPSELPSL